MNQIIEWILKRIWWLLIGLFLGIFIEYNWCLDNINYRISFYGYEKKGEQIVPIIKLRKHVIGMPGHHRLDEGVELRIPQTIEFDDNTFDELIRRKYCR